MAKKDQTCGASILDFAALTQHVYVSGNANEKIPDYPGMSCTWKRVDYMAGSHGFFAAAYENGDGKAVVAYRGSDGSNFMNDWLSTDARIAAGFLPVEQVEMVRRFYLRSAAKRKVIAACGHSLGGGLTQVLCSSVNLLGVTFNAPGMKNEINAGNQSSNIIGGNRNIVFGSFHKVVNFRMAEFVSTMTGGFVGKVVMIPGGANPNVIDFYMGHSMGPTVKALQMAKFGAHAPETFL
jgi:hypothetical protein